METFIKTVTSTLPVTEHRLKTYRQAQARDTVCTTARKYCQVGRPKKRFIHPNITPYCKLRSSLTLDADLLLYNHRIATLPRETLKRMHDTVKQLVAFISKVYPISHSYYISLRCLLPSYLQQDGAEYRG